MVQDGYLLKEQPEPEVGMGGGIVVQSGLLGEAHSSQIAVGGQGAGRAGELMPVYCLVFPLGPKSDFPVTMRLAATPLFSCCLVCFFKQYYHNRTSDGGTVLS